jgi:hypothetical protein
MASELVKKVARSIDPNGWALCDDCIRGESCIACIETKETSIDKAESAIKAVAEYLQSRPHDVNLVYWLGGVLLLDQLETKP